MANLGRLNEGCQVKDLWAFSSDKFNGESQVYDDNDGDDDYSPRRRRPDNYGAIGTGRAESGTA